MKNTMQLGGKRKGVSKKPKKCVESTDEQECSNNSNASKSIEHIRTKYSSVYADVDDMNSVLERAATVLEQLGNGLPNFMKCMLHSNVVEGFWLHLPPKSKVYLPKRKMPIVLVDECGNKYKTTYIRERHALSAGWKGFSLSQRLRKGDILIFRSTAPCRFKVHIVRVHSIQDVDAANTLVSMSVSSRYADSGLAKKKRKHGLISS